MKSCRLQVIFIQVTQKLNKATTPEQPIEPAILIQNVELNPAFAGSLKQRYTILAINWNDELKNS
jgi:hypothetical protein